MASFLGGTEKTSLLTGPQNRTLRSLNELMSSQLGRSAPVYEGQITPDATGNQLAAFQGVQGLAGQAGQAQPAINDMLQGQSVDGFNGEQYRKEAIIDPANLAYQDALEQMEAQYGGSWGQTGGFQDIMQKETARYGVGLGQTLADFAMNERDTANQQRAAGVDANFGQTENLANAYQAQLGMGGEERSIAGQQSSEDYNKWQAEQAYNNPWLGFLGPALGTQAFSVGQEQGWGRGFKPLAS